MVSVHGRSRLIVDIIRGVLADHPPAGERRVAVLVDPEPEHWSAADDAACVVVTSVTDTDVLRVIQRGADAVIDADDVVKQLPGVVAAVQAGHAVLSPAQARILVDAVRKGTAADRLTLTRRERQIIGSIIAGESVKQTAKSLGIAPKTVENLQSRLFKKLGARNRAQAVARAHELGLLDEVEAPPIAGGLHP